MCIRACVRVRVRIRVRVRVRVRAQSAAHAIAPRGRRPGEYDGCEGTLMINRMPFMFERSRSRWVAPGLSWASRPLVTTGYLFHPARHARTQPSAWWRRSEPVGFMHSEWCSE